MAGKQPRDASANLRTHDDIRNEAIRAKALARIDRDTAGMPADLARYAHDFIATQRTPETARVYAGGLARFLGWCRSRGSDPLALTRHDASLYHAWLRADRTASTVTSRVGTIRSFYRRLVDWDVVAFDPFDRVRLDRVEVTTPTPALTRAEVDRLLATCAQGLLDPDRGFLARRDFFLLYLGVRVAARRAEFSRMMWGDLSVSDGEHRLRIHGKGGTHKQLGLPSDLVELLMEWRGELERRLNRPVRASDAIFALCRDSTAIPRLDAHGRLMPMSPEAIGSMVKGRMREAGFTGDRYAAHALRATAATLAYESDASLLDVSTLLRHAALETTKLYIRRQSPGALRAASSWRPGAAVRDAFASALRSDAAGHDPRATDDAPRTTGTAEPRPASPSVADGLHEAA